MNFFLILRKKLKNIIVIKVIHRKKGLNMNVEQIKEKLKSKEYDFLRTDPHLGNNIILLGLGGSHAYGTNIETSDLDVRGCAINSKIEILTNVNFEQCCNETTDTTIYSLNKLIHLLSNCNPNTIELLGLKPEHYLYISPIGQELLDNKDLFLSKRAIQSFGGYAYSQLRRLDNKAARLVGQSERERSISLTVFEMLHMILKISISHLMKIQ